MLGKDTTQFKPMKYARNSAAGAGGGGAPRTFFFPSLLGGSKWEKLDAPTLYNKLLTEAVRRNNVCSYCSHFATMRRILGF